MSSLSAASMESYGRAYPYLMQLHILNEVEDGYKLRVHGSQSLAEMQSPLTSNSMSPTSSSSSAAVNIITVSISVSNANYNGKEGADVDAITEVGNKRSVSASSNGSVDSDSTFLFRDSKRRSITGIISCESFINFDMLNQSIYGIRKINSFMIHLSHTLSPSNQCALNIWYEENNALFVINDISGGRVSNSDKKESLLREWYS